MVDYYTCAMCSHTRERTLSFTLCVPTQIGSSATITHIHIYIYIDIMYVLEPKVSVYNIVSNFARVCVWTIIKIKETHIIYILCILYYTMYMYVYVCVHSRGFLFCVRFALLFWNNNNNDNIMRGARVTDNGPKNIMYILISIPLPSRAPCCSGVVLLPPRTHRYRHV